MSNSDARDRLLREAARVVAKYGCERTTLPQVARRAKIDLDCVHEEFQSKRDLIGELARHTNDVVFEQGSRVASNGVRNPEATVTDLLSTYFSAFALTGKRLIRELSAASFRYGGSVAGARTEFDVRSVTRISSILESARRDGVLRAELPSKRAAFVLHGLLVTVLSIYSRDELMTLPAAQRILRSCLAVAFTGWSKMPKGGKSEAI